MEEISKSSVVACRQLHLQCFNVKVCSFDRDISYIGFAPNLGKAQTGFDPFVSYINYYLTKAILFSLHAIYMYLLVIKL